MGVLLVDLSLAATHSRVRLRRTYWRSSVEMPFGARFDSSGLCRRRVFKD